MSAYPPDAPPELRAFFDQTLAPLIERLSDALIDRAIQTDDVNVRHKENFILTVWFAWSTVQLAAGISAGIRVGMQEELITSSGVKRELIALLNGMLAKAKEPKS